MSHSVFQNQSLRMLLFVVAVGFISPGASAEDPIPGTDAYGVELEIDALIDGQPMQFRSTGQATVQRPGPFVDTGEGNQIDVPSFTFDTTGQLDGSPIQIQSQMGTGKITRLPAGDFQVDSFFDITYRIDFPGGSSPPVHTETPARVMNTAPITGLPFSGVPHGATETTPTEGFPLFDSGQIALPLLDPLGSAVGSIQAVRIRFYPWIYCYLLNINMTYSRLDPAGPAGMANMTGMTRISHGRAFQEGMITQEIQVIEASGDGVQLREAAGSISSGSIVTLTESFPAESFFDVFFQVEIDGIPTFNKEPLRLQTFPTGVGSLPFENVQHFGVNCPIDLHSVENPNGPPVFRIDSLGYIPVFPRKWWVPYYSIYIVKLTPFCIPLIGIPFNLYDGFGGLGSAIGSGQTDSNGILDFMNLSLGQYSVVEDVPPGYEPITPPLQDIDLNTPVYAEDYYGTLDGRGFGGGPPTLPGQEDLQVGMSFELEMGGITQNVHVQGPLTIQRQAPMDPGDGRVHVDTEIGAMDLRGTNPFGSGEIRVRESTSEMSAGNFQQLDPTGTFFPCDSFFDIFVEISLDNGTTWNPVEEPSRMSNPAVDAYPPTNEMYLGPESDVTVRAAGSPATIGIIRKWWWWWLPWYEYYIPYINVPPPNTPTPTNSATATSTSTSTSTATATATPTASPTATATSSSTTTGTPTSSSTATASPTLTETPRDTATATNTPAVSPTPTISSTFTRVPTPTLTPSITNTVPPPTPTYTITQTYTPSRTPMPPPSPTPTGTKVLLYTIEQDTVYNGGASIALEGDVLIGGSLSTILGGRYDELLAPYLKDPFAEGRNLGLDALDAISITNGILTRAFFSTEVPFLVTNASHPLFGMTISDGDLLTKSGLVIPNAMIHGPFDLQDPTGVPFGDIGLDGVDIEGVTPSDYDVWTNSYYSSGGSPTPPQAILDVLRIFWSFEEHPTGPSGLGTTYTTGALAALPVGPGVPVSEDDVLETNLVTGGARVFRVGADGIPTGVPLILGGLFNPSANPTSVGLDALDMPNYPAESDEAGELGPVGILLDVVLFSTSIDDPMMPPRFIHGDLLADPPAGSTYVEQTNTMISGHSYSDVGDVGLDGVDCLDNVQVIPYVRANTPCQPIFLPNNVNNVGMGQGNSFSVDLRGLRGCEVQGTLRFQIRYASSEFQFNGAVAGPNFQLTDSLKGQPDGQATVELMRTGPGQEGEVIATLNFTTDSFSGDGTIEWEEFETDGGGDMSDQVPPVHVSAAEVPSQPLLAVPDPILSDSVQAQWFANPEIENVTAYTVSVLNSTGVAASVTVPATATAAVLEGLEPATEYTLSLVASNGAGDSVPAQIEFQTRFDPANPDAVGLLIQLSLDWKPGGNEGSDVQSAVPSPVDINLDGVVNGNDSVLILELEN